jgi:hypothetical protein
MRPELPQVHSALLALLGTKVQKYKLLTPRLHFTGTKVQVLTFLLLSSSRARVHGCARFFLKSAAFSY